MRDVAAEHGVSIRTLQRYIKMGLVVPDQVRPSGRPVFWGEEPCRENEEISLGSNGLTVSLTPIGTTQIDSGLDAYRFVQATVKKRRLVSQRSSPEAPKSENPPEWMD